MKISAEDELHGTGKHVRVEFNAAKTEIIVGTTTGSMLGFNEGKATMHIGRDRVADAKDLATIVDYYSRTQGVSAVTTVSMGIMHNFQLRAGTTIKGDV